MSPHFNDFLGSSPLVYVRHLMKKFDYKTAPIPVEEISESLKLAIEEIDPPQELATPALHEQLMQASSWLERDAMRIRVYKHAPRKLGQWKILKSRFNPQRRYGRGKIDKS